MRRPRPGGGGAGGSAAARAAGGGGRVLSAAAAQYRPCARGAPAAARAAWLRDRWIAMARPRRQRPRAWAPLLLLLLAGPVACAASPADDGAGAGGRGPRGRARGDSGSDEAVPRHDSSYGTFAGEFYDLRYLSEEGYPFPTAPPVDPFAKIKVDDCGKTKGCFRYGKPGCNAETCDYFLSYRMIGADVEFELSADTDGWVAVGFSSDKKMGGDDVMACVHDDNGRVRVQHFYNVGQWAKEIQRNPARDEEGVFENNRVTCRFKRPVNVPRDETIVDLHLSWYYLFAWGPAIQGSITRHDIDSPPTSERVVSIYKYEDIFMPSAAYQTFSSPFCLLLIVALTFYLLMGTP
ncbi:LOW QUALITY PROTEIN: DOMON domain-containing protein FRRS1L [Monodon monoceros]|uniref:LOW QUALITY PROTEIN: DOMON domain-containing protein FRRS1L n=1 Tax=Monodon monoceros TaxID=40151 RepID=UPI0010F516CC|nr:LOW QUALITY PROTEIN: DOMON domain-containing protein FRRS1L [Monodon monoceros]